MKKCVISLAVLTAAINGQPYQGNPPPSFSRQAAPSEVIDLASSEVTNEEDADKVAEYAGKRPGRGGAKPGRFGDRPEKIEGLKEAGEAAVKAALAALGIDISDEMTKETRREAMQLAKEAGIDIGAVKEAAIQNFLELGVASGTISQEDADKVAEHAGKKPGQGGAPPGRFGNPFAAATSQAGRFGNTFAETGRASAKPGQFGNPFANFWPAVFPFSSPGSSISAPGQAAAATRGRGQAAAARGRGQAATGRAASKASKIAERFNKYGMKSARSTKSKP